MKPEDILGPKVQAKPPKGARTVEEWASEWRISLSQMAKRMRQAKENGLMKSGRFHNPKINRPQVYYWPA